MAEVKTNAGTCRCGSVAYEVETDLEGLIECNCSHCYRKGLVLAFVEPGRFRLTADGPQTEYLFDTVGPPSGSTAGVSKGSWREETNDPR